jgi:polyhydroxyalkanoate synthesis repressor PhaR
MSNTEQSESAAPVVVKKYANRRLYNTESSSYITLDNLAELIRGGRDFVVYDAKSGEDITRGVLTQIIVEEESKGRALLPTAFLRQLIGFYGDSLQALVPRYLEQAMANFAHQQSQMRAALQQTMGNFFPFGMEEVGRQNVAMMERAMTLFAPFYRAPGGEGGAAADAAPADPAVVDSLEQELGRLREEVEHLRTELAARSTPKSEIKNESKAEPGRKTTPDPRPMRAKSTGD